MTDGAANMNKSFNSTRVANNIRWKYGVSLSERMLSSTWLGGGGGGVLFSLELKRG